MDDYGTPEWRLNKITNRKRFSEHEWWSPNAGDPELISDDEYGVDYADDGKDDSNNNNIYFCVSMIQYDTV